MQSVPNLQDAIETAIKQYVAEKTREAIQDVKRKLDEQLPEIAAEIGVRVAQIMNDRDIDSVIQIRLTPTIGGLRRG
jgi:hypothetical protein